jgi:hypothetical protein
MAREAGAPLQEAEQVLLGATPIYVMTTNINHSLSQFFGAASL